MHRKTHAKLEELDDDMQGRWERAGWPGKYFRSRAQHFGQPRRYAPNRTTRPTMDRTELTRIGAALCRQYEVAKQAPLTPSMLALLVQLREKEQRQIPSVSSARMANMAVSRPKK